MIHTWKPKEEIVMRINDIFTVIKRELKGIFKDKLLISQIIFLPFLIMVGYAMLMVVMSEDTDNNDASAYFVNAPEYMLDGFETMNAERIDAADIDAVKSKIAQKEAQLLIVFPDNFKADTENPQNIDIWYNSADASSVELWSSATIYLNTFQPYVFTINMSEAVTYDLSDEEQKTLSLFGSLLPTMLIMVVFITIMNISAEAIAGDKERGFLNTILITPASRGSIAAGKAFSIYILAVIGGLSTFGGMIVSLPKISKATGLTANIVYTFSDYALLFAVTMITVFASVSVLLIISTLSGSVKQATSISSVMTFVFMIPSLLLSTDSFEKVIRNIGMRNNFIPIWNTILNIRSVIMLDYKAYDIMISVMVNIVFCIAATAFVAYCFKNEKIVNG
ncbi:MAG: ABC transporter permease [Clostridium sp.]|nr:ABC transporter permease [Clostridium sp.]